MAYLYSSLESVINLRVIKVENHREVIFLVHSVIIKGKFKCMIIYPPIIIC